MGAILKMLLPLYLAAQCGLVSAVDLNESLPSAPGAVSRAKVPGPLTFALTFDKVPVQQLVMLFYDQCEKRGLVFDPAINKLNDLLTIKTPSMTCQQTRLILVDAMARAGVALESHGTYDVVRQVEAKDEREGWQEVIFRPQFRDAVELAEQSMIAVRKGMFAHQRRGAQVQVASDAAQVPESGANGATLTAKLIDKLVFIGPPEECKAVQSLLSRLDVPKPQVEISAGIYEFQTGRTEGSAVNAAIKLFNQKIGINVSGGLNSGSSVKLSLPSIDAALSLLDQDSRFHYVARPKVLVENGEQVTFNAGQEVRVTGSITLDRNGNPLQSITTMNAGVMMQATPFIRGDVVDLTLHQLVSDFVASPNNEPSVVKRDLTTRLLMQPGFVYVIGGLQTTRKTQSRQRFFTFSVGSSSDSSDTEIILLLSVRSNLTNS